MTVTQIKEILRRMSQGEYAYFICREMRIDFDTFRRIRDANETLRDLYARAHLAGFHIRIEEKNNE